MRKVKTLVDLARGTALTGDGATKVLAEDVPFEHGNVLKFSLSFDAATILKYATDADQGSPHYQFLNEGVSLVVNADYVFRPGAKNGFFNFILSAPVNVNKFLVESFLDV